MHTLMAVALFLYTPEVFWPHFAGAVAVVLGIYATREEASQARGLDKIVVFGRLLYAAPLAVFGGEHMTIPHAIMKMVPEFMPWRLFWAFFVGIALFAAALSMVLKREVQWSGMLLGIMFTLFVAMMDIPGAVSDPRNRFTWILAARELAFACGAFTLAATYMGPLRARGASALLTVTRIVISLVLIFYGLEHFLHPGNVPVVPLEMLTPAWIPGRMVIGYVTGAALIAGGVFILLDRKARAAATYLGSFILLVILGVYLPILIESFSAPTAAGKIQGLNYFADTLFFGGVVLVLANALRKATPMPA